MLSTTAFCWPERLAAARRTGLAYAARAGHDDRRGVPVHRFAGSGGTMGGMAAPQVAPVETPDTEEVPVSDRPWVTIVWDDPVNLMTYVTWVFQKLFGYSREKAERLMLDVHHKGKAVVSTGARERMEHDAAQLHAYGLWATVERS
ncbi:ATP-dependent Clp protease adaptor protein ClpS [Micromonospora sp. B006]|nr:ATP-dependent Clp protease adaptor protein ClpS [Micromonospora sp. B006]